MEDKKVMEIPIENIVPNPYQPRKVFSQAALEELSNSIKVYGILQPITVRQKDDKYELIAGERRFRAAKLANLQAVPAIINNMSDESSAVLALLENLQREDLNFIEEAEAYYNLMNDHNFTSLGGGRPRELTQRGLTQPLAEGEEPLGGGTHQEGAHQGAHPHHAAQQEADGGEG